MVYAASYETWGRETDFDGKLVFLKKNNVFSAFSENFKIIQIIVEKGFFGENFFVALFA